MPILEPMMTSIKTKLLTRVPFRELIASQAQGRFCDWRRKTDFNTCGQGRLTLSFVFAQFCLGLTVLSPGGLSRVPAPNKQELESESSCCSSACLGRTRCHFVLFEGSRAVTGRIRCASSSLSAIWRSSQRSSHSQCQRKSRYCPIWRPFAIGKCGGSIGGLH